MRRCFLSLLPLLLLCMTFQAGQMALAQTNPMPPQSPAAAIPAAKSLTLDQAQLLFRVLASQPDIAFGYTADGCYARAHLMLNLMTNYHVQGRKVWAFARSFPRLSPVAAVASLPDALTVRQPNGTSVTWTYHVAPVVAVREASGEEADYVLDPSLFDRPVTIGDWMGKMMGGDYKAPYLYVTQPGEAPVLPDGRRAPGSGYHPGDDPAGNLDLVSKKVMQEYQRRLILERRSSSAAERRTARETSFALSA